VPRLFVCSHRQWPMPRRLIYICAPLVAGEVAIREAQSRDRATEAIVIGALKIKARLHNGAGKGRADSFTPSTHKVPTGMMP